jgi:hypothetical protein
LSTARPLSSTKVGWRTARATIAAVTAPASQATGRQRGDSSRPVGNSSGVNTTARATVGYQLDQANQVATMAPGSDPGRVS